MVSPSTNWKRILVVNAMVTALAFTLNGGIAAPTWWEAFRRLLIGALYVNVVGTPAGLIIIEVNDFPNYSAVPEANDRLAAHVTRCAAMTGKGRRS